MLILSRFSLSFEISCQTTCLKEPEKFCLIYYFIFVKNKSEFVLVLNPKFDVSAQEKY